MCWLNHVFKENRQSHRTLLAVPNPLNLKCLSVLYILLLIQYSSEEDSKKESMRRKSLPSAFNVSGRLAASKQKTVPTKTLSEAAKSRRAIREKVFAKARRSPTHIEVSVGQ